MDARGSQCSVPRNCVDGDKINRTQVTICIIGCYLVSLRYIIILHFGKINNYLRTDPILRLKCAITFKVSSTAYLTNNS
jgi:hypothetical protein